MVSKKRINSVVGLLLLKKLIRQHVYVRLFFRGAMCVL
jgi:hypothetical protein